MEFAELSFLSVLTDMLSKVFDAVLAPVLRDVAHILIATLGKLISEAFSNFLIRAWVILLKLVYFLQQIFDIFSGYRTVKLRAVPDVSRERNLLEVFLELGSIQYFFLLLTMICVVVCLLTTIVMVVRSMHDMVMENKHPISEVLRRSMKASFTFMIIPFTLVFILQTVKYVPSVIDLAFGRNTGQAVSDSLFITVAEPAANNAEAVRMFSAGQHYENIELLRSSFNIKNINFTFAFVSSILMALIFLICIIQFIQRLFVILFLYLISPFFVAFIPLDEGQKFRRWKELFVGTFLSAYGPMIVMELYLMVVPMIVSGNAIRFDTGSQLMDVCLRLFIILGGAWAVYRSRTLMLQLFAPEAEAMTQGGGFITNTLRRARWRLANLGR